ncbi:MAG: glycosyltransferase family 8 protein [Bacillota bacterium]|jgi:lipopolysaccharide biosynthesis glycosyltransferase|nr:glycosyltransferase family 8 protein [Bacillota bacterium]
MDHTLHVVYSSDDAYACFLGVSMLSLFKNNQDFKQIHAYILDCGIGGENREKLLRIASEYRREISFLSVKSALEKLRLRQGAHVISVASYARLLMAELLPQTCGRALYLDCDTIVKDSLRGLWEYDLAGALIAGCQDTVDQYYLKVIGLPDHIRYLNAGILLIDLALWREEDILQAFMEVIERFGGKVPHHDQGIINSACGSRRAILPLRYNVNSNLYSFSARTIRRMYFLDDYYSQQEVDEAVAHPAIIHFTKGLVGRPWEEGSGHPERDTFWQYVKESPWPDLPMLPDSRGKSIKLFTFFYRLMPRRLFEIVYRSLIGILHRRW